VAAAVTRAKERLSQLGLRIPAQKHHGKGWLAYIRTRIQEFKDNVSIGHNHKVSVNSFIVFLFYSMQEQLIENLSKYHKVSVNRLHLNYHYKVSVNRFIAFLFYSM
jgi:hypothetical protein